MATEKADYKADRAQPGVGGERQGRHDSGREPGKGGPRDGQRRPDRELTAEELRERLADLDRLREALQLRLETIDDEGEKQASPQRGRGGPGGRERLGRGGDLIRAGLRARNLTEEDIQSAIAFASEVDESMGERLQSSARDEPEQAKRIAAMLLMRKERIERADQNDPALRRLLLDELRAEAMLMDAARQMRQASLSPETDEAEIASLKEELAEQAGGLFDVRAALRKHEISVLQERLDSLRASLEADQAGRDAEIQSQLERLLSRIGSDGERSPRDRVPGGGD